ncbi:response regulator [Bdellovibrio sp. HCB185ZH]|uniref:response regulator n=1 Tax=Bdellovibrio sp. HCB185ZH TaxID=3394235 RepID=UPI0039A56599
MKSDKSLVIIVEDAPDQVHLISSYLRAQTQDVEILSYPTVKESIETISKTEPKLVILDLVLQDGSGEEVLAYIKAHKPGVPVLVVTGDRSEETVAKLFEQGAHDYITKPIDDLIFRSKARSILSSRYVSPLNFLGRRDGIGTLSVKSEVKIIKMDENDVTLICPFHIAPGGNFAVTLSGVVVHLRVRHYHVIPGEGSFHIECQIVTKNLKSASDLRRAIKESAS